MNFKRSSGILMHPTSFYSNYGIGDLGKGAYDFIDFLILSKQKLWQTFPLGPTGYGDSPYQCFSAFAGNPLLLSIDILIEDLLLSESDIPDEYFDLQSIDYGKVINFKNPLFQKAYENFKLSKDSLLKNKFEIFIKNNSLWLEDYALFAALKDHFGGKAWTDWDKDIKLREEHSLIHYRKKLDDRCYYYKFIQYMFHKQWSELKAYANENGIKIIGDIPIFVAFDSADAWSNPELFLFDQDRKPIKVAGVPPDYFSETGQLWGNPIYDWDALQNTDFKWWINRIESNLELCDIIRIDHFRGFSAYWAVPYGEKTAINGSWEPCPGDKLFKAIEKALGKLPIIAEDLGVITPEVEELRDSFNFPGMKILQFAFDSQNESTHLPHHYVKNSVVYTGTHDNDTTVGWYHKIGKSDRKFADKYLNIADNHSINWVFIKCAWASTAAFALAPMQDILGLDSSARMNTPGVAVGNWQWRIREEDLNNRKIISILKEITEIYFR